METAGTEAVELEIEVTLQDVLRFGRWHYPRRWSSRITATVLGLFWVYAALRYVIRPGAVNGATFGTVSTLIAIWGLCFWALLRFAMMRAYRTNASLQEPQHLRVAEEGLTFDTASVSSREAWSIYLRGGESRDAFYLYVSSGAAHILPKRCFSSPEQTERFRRIVRVGMGAKANI